MKNIEKKWTLFLIATFVTFFGIVNVLVKGTKANEVPVNDNFEDINFYKEIINIYNENNGTSHDYTYNLSDEELATIERVLLDGSLDEEVRSITSIKGVEKLTGLKSIQLNSVLITNVNLSNNDMLEFIIINNDEHTITNVSLDLTNKKELIYLSLDEISIDALDLSNNTNLEQLELNNVLVEELNLSNNDELELLSIIDESKSIENVNLNLLDKVDLKYLNLNCVMVEELDLNANDKLEYLLLWDEEKNIKNVDLNLLDKVDLKDLSLNYIFIEELDLSNNNKLENITLYEVGFNREIKMVKGDTYNLETPIVLPTESTLGELKWESSDDEIITIDEDNVVTAHDVGYASVYLNSGTKNLIVHSIIVEESTGDDNEEDNDFGKIDEERKLVYGVVPGSKYGEKIGDVQVFDKDGVEIEDFAERILRTGDRVRISINNTEFNYTVSVLGDINGDGEVSKDDIWKMAKHIIAKEEITGDEYIASADINEDGKISLVDFVKLAKYIVNGNEL